MNVQEREYAMFQKIKINFLNETMHISYSIVHAN